MPSVLQGVLYCSTPSNSTISEQALGDITINNTTDGRTDGLLYRNLAKQRPKTTQRNADYRKSMARGIGYQFFAGILQKCYKPTNLEKSFN